ncbi:MAG: acetyl-CoA hydrolase, partial [Desulfobacterales bacterium]
MAIGSYWADDYVEKKKSVQEAIGLIRSGQRIFIGSYCGEPQCLVRGLAEVAQRFSNIEIIRLMSQETTPLYLIANKTQDQSLGIRSFYLGSASSAALARNMRFYTPVIMSAIPQLFTSRRIPLDVALVQV